MTHVWWCVSSALSKLNVDYVIFEMELKPTVSHLRSANSTYYEYLFQLQ